MSLQLDNNCICLAGWLGSLPLSLPLDGTYLFAEPRIMSRGAIILLIYWRGMVVAQVSPEAAAFPIITTIFRGRLHENKNQKKNEKRPCHLGLEWRKS